MLYHHRSHTSEQNYQSTTSWRPYQRSEGTNVLHLPAEVSAQREAEILDHQHSSNGIPVKSDNENNSNSPNFDDVYEQYGSAAIIKMTTISPDHTQRLSANISDDIYIH